MQRHYPRLLGGAESFAGKVMDISEFIHTKLGYSNLPIEDATVPFPKPDKTPPVTMIIFIVLNGRMQSTSAY
jgi:hypothetical protein